MKINNNLLRNNKNYLLFIARTQRGHNKQNKNNRKWKKASKKLEHIVRSAYRIIFIILQRRQNFYDDGTFNLMILPRVLVADSRLF